MNSTALSIKGVKAAVAALLAVAAFMVLAIGAGSAKASTVGDDVNAEFNYVGLFVGTTVAGDVDDFVLQPPDTPIAINGKYTDTNGNFSVDKDTGLVFPPVEVDLDVVKITGEIGLTENGTGSYNESTGAMDLSLKLSLTLGTDDLEALSQEVGIPLGTGALKCKLAPLAVEFKTSGGWPHPGKAFEDKEALTDGALAGAWRYKPSIVAVEGDQSVCNIIGGFLKPVGGIWLANSTDPLADMPTKTADAPPVETCEEHGKVGNMPNCEDPPEPTCEDEGKVGTYPDCTDPACPVGKVGTPPDCQDHKANISKVAVTPAKGSIKKGKKATLTIKVTNTGNKATTVTVKIKSSNKQVKAPKTVKVTVGAKKTVSKKITVSATKKAKGKATITASANGKSGKSTLTVKK